MKQQNRTKIIVAIFLLAIAISVATVVSLSVLEIRAHKHEYTVSVVAPTCVDDGYTLHTCACGNSYKDGFVDALGHDFAEEFTVDSQPDCTAAGSKSKHCSRCESTAEVTVIPANGHSFGEWDTISERSCTAQGIHVRVCGACGESETKYETPLGHDYGGWGTVSEASCEAEGLKIRSCSRCESEEEQIIEALGHKFEYLSDVYYHEGNCARCNKAVHSKHAFEGTVCADCKYEVHPTQGLRYELNEDGASYKVTGIGEATDVTDLVIFSTHNGLPVTEVGATAFSFSEEKITSLVIYENVKQLSNSCFCYCYSLTSVCLPDTLTVIAPTAFNLCGNLNTVTVDGANPVYHDVGGKYIVETATKTLFLGGADSEIPADGTVTSIGDYAFSHRAARREIIIPETITAIGNYAFYDSGYMKSIKIPSSVKSIGEGAFLSTGLENVILEDGITSIGSRAFSSNIYLSEIFISKSVTQIGERVFDGCYKLNSIVVDSQNPVYHSAGNCLIETQTKTLVASCEASIIPNDGSVTAIGNYAFWCCRDLVSVELPDSVTSIGKFAFAHLYKLETIKLPEKLTLIDEAAFLSCRSLKTIMYSGTALQWVYVVKNKYGDPWDSDFPKDYRVICSNGILLKDGTVLPLE